MRHFMKIRDLGCAGAHNILKRAQEMKETSHRSKLLDGKVIALIFEKASTRTRLSFEVGIKQLGGDSIFMTPAESQLGRSEPLKDTARVISRYCAGMVVRTFGQEKLDELAEYGSVPVINALTDQGHPCQVMSDLLTIYERTPDFSKLRVAWIGDGNNMARSWMEAAIYFPFELFMAFPKTYEPDSSYMTFCMQAGAKIFITNEPRLAMDGVHYVNTDVWASMGQEAEQKARAEAFRGFYIDKDLLKFAHPDCRLMHCLPAHREEEVSTEVFEKNAAVIFDQAENRLHAQKAILEWAFSESS